MATDPVTGSQFFERDDVLVTLEKRLVAFKDGYRQNVALVGPRGAGKSSILHQFLSLLEDPSIISIPVEVPQGSLDLFMKRFLAGCLTGLLKSKGEEIPWDVPELIQKAKQHVPKTVRHMRSALKLLNLGRQDEAFREVLAMPRILREETLMRALVVMDSFHDLESLPVRDPFGTLGKEIMIDKDTMYLVASSRPFKARHIFREKLNLLFGNFEVEEIKNFDFEQARRIIQAKLGKFNISHVEERFLIQITDSHPFYLKVILERIEELAIRRRIETVSREIIFEAFSDEMMNVTGALHQYLYQLSQIPVKSKNAPSSLAVLTGIALGERKILPLARYTGKKINETQKVVARLLEDELIEKDGVLFLIPDTLFRFWLKHVAHLIYFGFEVNLERRAFYFKRELERVFQVFVREQSKDLPKRVEELFRVFSGETITLGSSKVQCPVFQDVISKPTNGRVFPVFARSLKGSWLCQIASGPVREEDIRIFLEDVKKQNAKIARKVVVALSGMDLNARLMAKEKKITLWDLQHFNQLLDIYDRAKVIL